MPRGGEGRGPGCQLAPTVAVGGLRFSQPVLSFVKHLTTNTSLGGGDPVKLAECSDIVVC